MIAAPKPATAGATNDPLPAHPLPAMTDQEQRIALCKWVGWTWDEPYGVFTAVVNRYQAPDGSYRSQLPDTDSLDVLHEMENKLNNGTLDMRSLYYDNLALCVNAWPNKRTPDQMFELEYAIMTATAAQRREALLRTLGLLV